MNVSGHRIRTIEIESALVSHPRWRRRRSSGQPDEITGQAIVAFVTLGRRGGSAGEARRAARARRAEDRPDREAGRRSSSRPELPKTRSGKIMRRLLRDIAEQRALGDTTTLADPSVVEEIKERAEAEPAEA